MDGYSSGGNNWIGKLHHWRKIGWKRHPGRRGFSIQLARHHGTDTITDTKHIKNLQYSRLALKENFFHLTFTSSSFNNRILYDGHSFNASIFGNRATGNEDRDQHVKEIPNFPFLHPFLLESKNELTVFTIEPGPNRDPFAWQDRTDLVKAWKRNETF